MQTYPPLSIARYSFVQLSELEKRSVNELAHGLTNLSSLSWELEAVATVPQHPTILRTDLCDQWVTCVTSEWPVWPAGMGLLQSPHVQQSLSWLPHHLPRLESRRGHLRRRLLQHPAAVWQEWCKYPIQQSLCTPPSTLAVCSCVTRVG